MKPFPSRFLLLALVGAVLAAACFVPGLTGGFMFDDWESILRNRSIHLTKLSLENVAFAAYSFQPGHGSRSLAMLSFALDYWRGGLDPHAFKTTNVLIHAVTVVALAFFFRSLLLTARWPARRAAASAVLLAIVWAVHPLQVSSVLYVVQRMQTLVTLFMVLALWAYLRMRQAQMQGERSRGFATLTAFFWVLGLASKEDAVLLPLYTLCLELTVLRFNAASPRMAAFWRKGYALLSVAGAVGAVAMLVHYWHWDPYPTRDFSSIERLMTQGRVLVMYLGQILLPLPSSMHFFYDDLIVSRGLLNPPTTVLAWGGLLALLAWAWCWRTKRPLFALGVFLFFFGHSLTSNVLNLEMAFEHRNHFPLIGVVLAVGDLAAMAWARFGGASKVALPLVGSLVLVLGSTTVSRARTWGDPLRFAEETLRLAPRSERAWAQLGSIFVEQSQFKPGPALDRAIDINTRGAQVTGSAIMLGNLVIYKTIRGDVSTSDWAQLEERLQHVTINAQNKGIAFNILDNLDRGMALDPEGSTRVLEIVANRIDLTPNEYLRMAAYINNNTTKPERAFPFLRRAVEAAPLDDPDIAQMFTNLSKIGLEDWADKLRAAQKAAHRD